MCACCKDAKPDGWDDLAWRDMALMLSRPSPLLGHDKVDIVNSELPAVGKHSRDASGRGNGAQPRPYKAKTLVSGLEAYLLRLRVLDCNGLMLRMDLVLHIY